MPEYLRALTVILVLATATFVFAKAPACALASTPGDFERRRNLWLGVTLAAFLGQNFWIFIIAVAALLLFALPRETNRLAMYFFLVFAAPRVEDKITGLGVFDHLFAINYFRLLALVVLLPTFLTLWRRPDTERFGRSIPDKLLAGYLILTFVLFLQVNSFTNTLRHGFFYAFIDLFLPYYVASRSLKNLRDFRDALMGFVVGALVLSALGVFEYGKGWLLYSELQEALGVPWPKVYLLREGSLRAQATAGQPIPLGYFIAIAAGFFLYLRKLVPNPMSWGLALLLLIAGLISTGSRGPWAGAVAMALVFLATGTSALTAYAILGVLGMVGLPVLLATPWGDALLAYLPFVGTVDAFNVNYRVKLMEIGLQIIMHNPWFGAYDYYLSEEIKELIQGQGIVDIVNTYLSVALEKGFVGLSLFTGLLIAVGAGIFKGMRSLADRNDEHYVLGQALLATLLGMMLIIFTCSNVGHGPVIYGSVAGLGVAYARMLALAKAREAATPAAFQPASMTSGSYLKHG